MNRLVPCLTWVKRGAAKGNPDKIQLDKEELMKLIENTKDDLNDLENSDDSEEENTEHSKDGDADMTIINKDKKKKDKDGTMDVDDNSIQDKYGLDDYDDEQEAENQEGSHFCGLGDIANFATNEDDPYITLKEDVDSDEEDSEIKPTDNLLLCGRLEDDMSILEVHVYNEESSSFYVHHDYFLPVFPIVVEWLDFDGYENAPGNLVAVGTMEPVIEIWDLDVMESVGCTYALGSPPQKKKKKLKKKESAAGHTEAVLDLSWNQNARHVLASASADKTVILWDLTEGKVAATFTQHTKEVQCCKWHPQEQQTLLTGSFDQTVKVFDCSSDGSNNKSWNVLGEVEKVMWNHFKPFQFLACTDQGNVYCMDIRQEKPLFTLGAHSKPITGLSLSSQIPGLLVTTSEDKTMKVWDIQGEAPSHVFSRNLQMNKLHCVGCCPEAPFVFAFGGDARQPKVWDIRQSAAVRQHFINRMPETLAKECEGDDKDVAEADLEEETASAMGGLKMDDDGDDDTEVVAAAAAARTSKKKKKKKRNKKKTILDGQI